MKQAREVVGRTKWKYQKKKMLKQRRNKHYFYPTQNQNQSINGKSVKARNHFKKITQISSNI